MLEQQDYNQIKDIFNEGGGKLFEEKWGKLFEEEGEKLEKRIIYQLGEIIEDNILPVLEDNKNELKKFIEDKINPLPDKAFISDKLINLESNLLLR